MDSSIDEAAALPGGADGAAADPASGTVGSGDREDGREAAGPVPGGGPVVSGGGAETAGTLETNGITQETAGTPETNGTTQETAGGAEAGGDAVVSGDVGGGGAVGMAGERKAVAPTSLSPSRASDFMQCPLLYRFRVIDRLPEKPSAAATRGTLVHAVLERLFDAPAGERTAPRAKSLIPGQWDRLRESRPEVTELFADDPEGERLAGWLAEAERLVERWFTLEDPTRLEPAERELFVEAELESGLRLRGIIDRVDVAPTGEVRIVDYKTGKAPRPEYAEGALFQMKFYALVVWRLKRVVPRRLQLVYLGSGDVLTYDPVPADLERVERKLHALWEAIRQATETGNWRPRPTKLCGWCDHQARCPEFGGTPPPYPLPVGTPGSGTV
ncbi:RecB family exonuclease [Streptomyces musisoli]|nr:PD-(D/E)XK nuclease family protein [Streptomyces musisoli]